MVKGEWWTQVSGRTDGKGEYRFRGFRGTYDVKVRDSKVSFTMSKGENCWQIEI